MARRRSEFEAFYAEHFARVCRSLTVALGDRLLAEESVQEAFIRAYVYWRRVAKMERPVGWVHVVAMRVALKRRPAAPLSLVTPVATALADTVVDRESRRAAIAQLPERQRIAIVLRYLADLPLADVARAMGCAVGTVKSTLFSALARLHVELDEVADLEEVQPDAR